MKAPVIVDSHCHLNFESLSHDLKSVIANANEAGVKILHTISTKFEEVPALFDLTLQHENILMSVGVHPLNLNEDELVRHFLREAVSHPKVISIGETGLDYHYGASTKDLQKRFFLEHIRIAQEFGLPLVIHSRDADDDMMEILSSEMKNHPFSGVMHCFTSGAALAEKCIEMGLYLSVSGVITFKNADNIIKIFQQVPINKILIETDSPFLAPAPYRGKRNEPAYILHTLKHLAVVRGMQYEDIAQITTENFFRLFTKARILKHLL